MIIELSKYIFTVYEQIATFHINDLTHTISPFGFIISPIIIALVNFIITRISSPTSKLNNANKELINFFIAQMQMKEIPTETILQDIKMSIADKYNIQFYKMYPLKKGFKIAMIEFVSDTTAWIDDRRKVKKFFYNNKSFFSSLEDVSPPRSVQLLLSLKNIIKTFFLSFVISFTIFGGLCLYFLYTSNHQYLFDPYAIAVSLGYSIVYSFFGSLFAEIYVRILNYIDNKISFRAKIRKNIKKQFNKIS